MRVIIFALLFVTGIVQAKSIHSDSPYLTATGQFGYAFPLMESAEQLLPGGWALKVTNNGFRQYTVRYATRENIVPNWSAIYDDFARRHGLAMLVNMSAETIIVTPSNGFATPGIHYIDTRIAANLNRYQWNHWLTKVAEQEGQWALAQQRNEERAHQAQLKRNLEVVSAEKRKVRTAYQNLTRKLETDYAAKQRVLGSAQLEVERKRRELNDELRRAELAQKANELAQSDYLAAKERYRTMTEELDSQIAENEAVKAALITAYEDKKSSLEHWYQERLDAETAQTNQLQATMETELAAIESQKRKYYPKVERTLPAGDISVTLSRFLEQHWGYQLNMKTHLLSHTQKTALQRPLPLHFTGSALEVDMSKVACSLTRDIEGITVLAQVVPNERTVYVQLHSTTEDVRSQMIAACFD